MWIAIIHSMSPDELENPCLVFREDVDSIERLMPDGSWKQLSFAKDGKTVELDLMVKMLYLEVLRVK